MRRIGLALLICLLSAAVSFAKPIAISWPKYVATAPVNRLVLYRATSGNLLVPYRTFQDLTTIRYIDSDVKHNRTFCYALAAITVSGVSSALTDTKCARPIK